MASSPLVWTPDKRMILQSAVADLSPEAFQAVVGRVFGPATLAMRRRWSPYGDCEFSITAAGVVDAVDG